MAKKKPIKQGGRPAKKKTKNNKARLEADTTASLRADLRRLTRALARRSRRAQTPPAAKPRGRSFAAANAAAGGAAARELGNVVSVDPAVADAIGRLESSISVLRQAADVLSGTLNDLDFDEQGLAEEQIARLEDELLMQELTLGHLRTIIVVNPPPPDAGQALSDALAKLEAMKNAVSDLVLLLDLAAAIAVAAKQNHDEVESQIPADDAGGGGGVGEE